MVQRSTPRLRGLGWLGLSFASGAGGAFLLTTYAFLPHFFSVVLSDFLVLTGFVLLQKAILDMKRSQKRVPLIGIGLMIAQLFGYLMLAYVTPSARGRVALFGLLAAVQLGETMLVLARTAKRGLRLPAWFSACVLLVLVLTNLFRSFVLLFVPFFEIKAHATSLQTFTFLVFIATAMGIAFGFFWMTTAELSHELERMASTDPLTRIYNRRVFRQWCDKELERSRRSGVPFSLIMMDLDHFKKLNDRFGHFGGDAMLCAVVEKMQDSVRGIDVLGRWGGEEFVALLPNASAEAAVMVAQRIRGNIESLNVCGPQGRRATDERMRMTLSLGVATFRGDEDELDEIFHRADKALYDAKAAGRNQVLAMA